MSMPGAGLPRLVATDLDGTVVRSDDTTSGYTKEVFARLRAAGSVVVVATGRGPRLTSLVLRDLPAAQFMVLGGGGRVVDLRDPSRPVILRDARLDGLVLLEILTALEAAVGPLNTLIEAGDGHGAPLWGDSDEFWPYPDVVEARVRAEALAGPVIKGFARHGEHDADALLAVANALVPLSVATVTQSGMGYIEICPPGVDKASGLAIVAETLGFQPTDVLAFGDMPNDLAMLRWAGYGRVAVANAHPEVLALADEVTGSNNADGVARYLDRLLAAEQRAAAPAALAS